MRRRITGVGAWERARRVLVALAFGAVVTSAGAAFAQTTPPPAATPPSAATPPATSPAPAAATPPAAGTTEAAPAGAPALEAGDTAAPGAARVETLDPMHSPPLTAAPVPGLTSPLVAPVPPARRPVPFYRKEWFWGAVAVVVVVGIVVTVLTLGTGDPATPNTRLGDMNGF